MTQKIINHLNDINSALPEGGALLLKLNTLQSTELENLGNALVAIPVLQSYPYTSPSLYIVFCTFDVNDDTVNTIQQLTGVSLRHIA